MQTLKMKTLIRPRKDEYIEKMHDNTRLQSNMVSYYYYFMFNIFLNKLLRFCFLTF